MISFPVTQKKAEQLRQRMGACGLREEDLDETFISSSGPGGQKVNKSATCVCLLHRPTGLSVKMQKSRSQPMNRFLARRRLCELLEEQSLGPQSPRNQQRSRIRKQKDRRRRRRNTSKPTME
ncbi:MAG: peptide chain release factor-like protein [Phycisphaerae bacterium]|nr:peptide chain release factor-like protein [Phycisphaerae bacterium]